MGPTWVKQCITSSCQTERGALLVTSVVSTYRQTALLGPQQDIHSSTLLDDKTHRLQREQQHNYACSVDSVYDTTPMELLPFEASSHYGMLAITK